MKARKAAGRARPPVRALRKPAPMAPDMEDKVEGAAEAPRADRKPFARGGAVKKHKGTNISINIGAPATMPPMPMPVPPGAGPVPGAAPMPMPPGGLPPGGPVPGLGGPPGAPPMKRGGAVMSGSGSGAHRAAMQRRGGC